MKSRVLTSIAFVVFASLASPSVAQSQTGLGHVVDVCSKIVRIERLELTNEPDGACLAVTDSYLRFVKGQQAPVRDRLLADLVAELSHLLFLPNCRIESEIAKAILMASSAADDAEQRAQIELIYQTVNACDFVVTAAIATPNRVSLVDSQSSNGLPASQN
ncbi:hypothetical protein [Devosia nitrariae]|uniref:Uncharacterized protein n=1 Tax=Devosia nitrariae TaxID=2071872 RepID=A0ABQ5WDS3_9HYPH|nr:hypothetical protein [Devosia nitrariae]GLQ57934.1 hypothetical protein GCM10010862_51930 [Devosia nitrariae]